MNRIIVALIFLAAVSQLVKSQSNPDDFWLEHGFSSGQTVLTNSGYFYDDGGYGLYQEGQDWNVTFCSENGNPITLDFNGFRTHFGGVVGDGTYDEYDYMTIEYPGASYYAYHNDTPEFSFTSQSTCITIGFHSDSDGMVDSGWVAEIYALAPPFNNDPSGAEELIVGNSCSPSFYTNKGAFNTTSLGSPPCKTYFGGDVWFRFVVPPSGTVRIETFAGTLTYAILDIYRSENSTILPSERIACVDDAGAMPSVTLGSPTVNPGETIYIRLFGEQAKSGLFGICATDPSAPVTGFSGPGGVGDLTSLDFWFKPDNGILDNTGNAAEDLEPVKTWVDHSGNENHLVQSNSGLQPLFFSNEINGMGSLHFDGVNDLFELESGSGDAPLHWFAAGSFSGTQRQTMISIGDALSTKTASISRHSDGRYFSFTTTQRFGPELNNDQFYIINASHLSGSPYHYLNLDGSAQVVDPDPSALETDGSIQVGASWNNSEPFAGRISELVQYSKILNSAQEIIVNNYLAAKYNIELDDHNYYPYKTSYQHDVAGIGRVNANNMHTKAGSAGILTISGADDLNDNEFLFFGHDNKDFLTWTTSGIPAGDTNIVRLERQWRVKLVGSPGEVSVNLSKDALPGFPEGFSAYNVLVDSDGDFSSGAIAYGPYAINGELIINNVPVSDGDYLAIAAVRPIVSFSTATSEEFENISNPPVLVALNYPVSTIVEISYSVIGSTATPGIDFSLAPSSVFINPGEHMVNILPLIFNDTIPEIPDEYFDIEIKSETPGVQTGPNSVIRHTILNDDLDLEILSSTNKIGECPGSSAQMVAIAHGSPPFSYSWLPNTGLNVNDNDTVTASPTVTTTYTVEVTDFYGHTESAQFTLEVVPAPPVPAITAGGPTSFCNGDSVKLSAPSGFMSYIWSSEETSDTLWVFTSGEYNVITVDSFGCHSPVSVSVAVLVNPLPSKPVVSIEGLTSFCEGDSITLRAPEGYLSYLWSDWSTDDTLVVKNTGNYSVTVEGEGGCWSPESDAVEIIMLSNPEKPVITAGGPLSICEGDSVALSVPGGPSAFYWNNVLLSREITVKTAGMYEVYIEDANGCLSPVSDPVSVEVYPGPEAPVLTALGDLAFCAGGSVELEAESGFEVYYWSDGGDGRSRTISIPGVFSVSGSDINGCKSVPSNEVVVTVNPIPDQPAITPPGPLYVLIGDSVQLAAPANSSYLWYPGGETAQAIYVKASGDYSVTVENEFGCWSILSDAVTVTVSDQLPPPEVTASGPLTFCRGGTVILSGPEGYTGYKWSGGENDRTITVSESSAYSLVVMDENGYFSFPSEEITITVNDIPDLSLVQMTEPTCAGNSDGSITVEASGGLSPYGFEWTGSETTTSSLTGLGKGNYSVTVTDQNSCSSALELELGEPGLLVVEMLVTNAFCPDFSDGSVELVITGGNEPYSISWKSGENLVLLDQLPPGTYEVDVFDDNNCTSNGTATVGYDHDFCFTVPEIITPNNDGWNDEWRIEGLEVYPEVTLEIFDRTGRRVFYSEGHEEYFKGMLNGKELPMESYHYVIDLHNGTERIIGNITIIR